MAGVNHELLLGGELEHIADRREGLAVGAEDFDSLRSILEMLDVVVGVERGEPHDTAVAALHSPHPVDGIGVDAAHRGIQHDAAEHFETLDVFAGEPGPVRRRCDMVLEHQPF